MRWKGLIFLAVIIAIGVVLSLFFLDKWVESGLEKAGSAAVGAKVEIDGLDLDVAGLSIEWQRLQVTDPNSTMQNVLETGRTAFQMDVAALLRKKTVIREMTLADVRTGTPRETDGAIPKKPKKEKKKSDKPDVFDKTRSKLTAEIQNLPVMDFDPARLKKSLNLDSLIVMAELSMPQKLDSSKADVLNTSKSWETFFREFQPEEDLQKIRITVQQINPKAIKTIPELVTALDKLQSANKTLRMLQDTVKARQKQFKIDFNRTGSYIQSVDDWYKADYANVLAKAKLPDLSVKNIGLMLFGGTVVHRVNQTLATVQTIRKYMPKKSDKTEKAKPERMKGQTIHYANRHGYPEFLIETAHLSGQTGSTDDVPGLILQGEANGINSQPWVYGRPTEVNLQGQRGDGRSIQLSAMLDHVEAIAKDRFELRMDRVSLNNVSIQESAYLPSKIQKGVAAIQAVAVFEGDQFDITLNVTASNLGFDFSSMNTSNQFIGIVRDVIQNLNTVTLNVRITGEGDDLTMRMDSNLDDRVSKELKAMGSKALQDAQNKVRARLDQIKREKMAEVDKLYKEKRAEYQKKIDTYAEQVEAQRVAAEAKIDLIKKDIDSKKKAEENKLKDKAGDLIDGLF
ncbi:TIGR03545 family protein [candidate division KSB1 bacterium]|nr:TIGR03545 family protein [candidate division KSB1 bacterium]